MILHSDYRCVLKGGIWMSKSLYKRRKEVELYLAAMFICSTIIVVAIAMLFK